MRYHYSQSAYRSSYSCETAFVKIHNDILSILDAKSNAVVLLFDLSPAFDTVKHDLLPIKLSAEFGYSDVALEWFSTYLNNRSYFVKGAGCTSHTVDVKYSSILAIINHRYWLDDSPPLTCPSMSI